MLPTLSLAGLESEEVRVYSKVLMHPTAFSRALPSQLGFDLGNVGMTISRIEDCIIASQYSSATYQAILYKASPIIQELIIQLKIQPRPDQPDNSRIQAGNDSRYSNRN